MSEIDKGVAHKAIQENAPKIKESEIYPNDLASLMYKKDLLSLDEYHKIESKSKEQQWETLVTTMSDSVLNKKRHFEAVKDCLNELNCEDGPRVAESIENSYKGLLYMNLCTCNHF